MWNLVFLFAGFFLTSLLLLVFISKKRVRSFENRIFFILTIANFIGFISEIFLQIAVRLLGAENIIGLLLGRLYLIYILAWMGVFSIYTFLVTRRTKENEPTNQGIPIDKTRQYKIMRLKHIIFIIITGIISLILPMLIYFKENEMYSYGAAVDFAKAISAIYVIIWIVRLVFNYKMMREKKVLPILVTIFLLLANVILQTINPTVLIATFTMMYTCYVLFFTIENPDLKMLHEMALAKDMAEKASRAKSDFLSSMSHEIRTPLNAIVGLSQLNEDVETLEESKANSKDIVNASKTLLEIVGNVLDMSKIESGNIEITDCDYNPYETFDNVTKIIDYRFKEKNLQLNVKIAPDLPNVLFGDSANIKKVLLNLLTNAVKYTSEGHVDFVVNCINKDNVCRLIISVEDTGRGIKPEQIDKLFTKFNRLEKDMNTTTEGTGLGLAITKHIMELMGGNVTVQSVYGSGSKFTITLNQRIKSINESNNKDKFKENAIDIDKLKLIDTDSEPNTINTELKEKINLLDFSGKKILLIDDNNLNLKVAARLLKNYKCEMVEASSGQECIDKINNGEKFDLLFADIMMPNMSGTEMLKILKDRGYSVPIVALTADVDVNAKDKYISAGFDDYIGKPIKIQELEKVLKKFLS